VESRDLGELSAAIEVAAYAIVAEAVTNAARHAHAKNCDIAVVRVRHALIVTVRDDGIGLDGAGRGLGCASMVERAEELGGWCQIGTDPSAAGTLVTAHLPIRTSALERPHRELEHLSGITDVLADVELRADEPAS
jgi:signal transduction histidine kinase